ncbi:MAG: bifunctional tRNA pseudouridine(32) synthase/ribosomal large subunit pseudouridine synthase RluA [Pseudomonadales bacterium]|nr:bifunctional tRNA pseudouridine(32) synthase/ribosomal large subunit pseudouridine synthase RluA [Pseudomonadales bacterium]
MIVVKPHGLLSVPGRLAQNSDSLISRVQQEHGDARIVHRLDCETSGLMVLALSAEVHKQLSALFAERQVEKTYTAVVKGLPTQKQGSVDLPLICDWPNRPRQKVCFDDGKQSLTHYRVISNDASNQTSRIALFPHTGRSHQLRVHMAAIGHPILGDEFYADKETYTMAKRMLLHAESLSFIHPVTAEPLTFSDVADF